MNSSSYEVLNDGPSVSSPILASIINRMSGHVITTASSFGKFQAASGSAMSSDFYGSQDVNDILIISPANQTSQSVHIATLAVCNVLIGIVVLMGCVGNGAVIVQVITNWNARLGFAPLILNLAVSDFLICSCLSPVFLIFLFRSPPTPNIFCGLFTFMGTICTLSSLLSMTAIALHRYRLLSSSSGQRYLSIPISLLTLAFIWALGFSVALAGILYVSSNMYDPFQKCELINVSGGQQQGNLTDFAISFLAPVCSLAFICTVVSCLVTVWVARLPACWKNACEFYHSEAARTDKKPKMSEVVSIGFKQLIGCFSLVDKETRILYLVAILVASFCWTPILIAQILTLSAGESLVLYQLKLCGIALVFLNSALHPYIYTEYGWRLKHRYRVCLHAAFDCHRISPADQWSLGGGMTSACMKTPSSAVEHPLVVSVGTVTDDFDTTNRDTTIRITTTMGAIDSVLETKIDSVKNQRDLIDNSTIDGNLTNGDNHNGNHNIDLEFADETEDNDTLDSGIDRDALSEVDDINTDTTDNNRRQAPVSQQTRFAIHKEMDGDGRAQNYDGSLDSLVLAAISAESPLYCVDAAENLTVSLPPRNSTPTVTETGAVGIRGKSDGAIIARHSPLSSWSTTSLPHCTPAPTTTSARQRHLYHYHHLHHYHHVILFPNNGDCVGAADNVNLHPQTCHAACCQEYESVKDCEPGPGSELKQQQQQEDNEEKNLERGTFCVHKNCSTDFQPEMTAASVSANKAADDLLRLLKLGETPSSSPTSAHSSSIPHRIVPRSTSPCTCPSSSLPPLPPPPFSQVVTDSEEDRSVHMPLISHYDRSTEHRRHPIHHHNKMKRSEYYWYPRHDDGVFVTEHTCADSQHPVHHPSHAHYHPEYSKCYPTHLQQNRTVTHSHIRHKSPHEQTQTDMSLQENTYKYNQHRVDR